jgi:hypothetical protein
MDGYAAEIEQKMQRFFGWLSEKDRRRYAAVEAAKLGHGGVEYMARILGCDPQTMRQGRRDLEEAEDAGTHVVLLGDGAGDGTRLPHTLQQAGWSYACRTATRPVATWAGETFRLEARGAWRKPGRLLE